MEVDRAAGLELGDLAVGHPDGRDLAQVPALTVEQDRRDSASPGELGEVAFDGVFGASPQFAGVVVPDGVVVVVVAIEAQRLTEDPVAFVVTGPADLRTPV